MDTRFAMLAALVANLWTDGRKKRWTPEDFMPDYEKAWDEREAQEETAPASVTDKVKAFFGMLVQAGKQAPPPAPPHPSTAVSTPALRMERGDKE